MSFTIICISVLFTIVTLYYLTISVIQLYKKERRFVGNGYKGLAFFILSLFPMAGVAYCLYNVPNAIMGGTWAFLQAEGPYGIYIATISLSVVIPLFYIYFLFTTYFVHSQEEPYFALAFLSIVSGLGNSLIIFVINEALNRSGEYRNALQIYFLIGLLIFIASAMIARRKLIAFTNDLVYNKRMELTNKILRTSFQKFETIGNEKIYAVLNNDTETISGFVNAIVNGLTSLVSITCSFIYLGLLNVYGLLASILVIVLAAAAFFTASWYANSIWEKTRDIQNVFFKFINDLVNGFKELSLHTAKRNEFKKDMQETCDMYRKTRLAGEFSFIGVTVFGEVLFTAVIGVVVFIFPLLFIDIQGNTLRNYVFIYLYMSGSVTILLRIIPDIVRIRISWKRINTILKEVSLLESKERTEDAILTAGSLEIELKDIDFQYKDESNEHFTVGPINYTFKSGEIVFITGGNGSGKSTLAKLISGLYTPDNGKIYVNHEETDAQRLQSYFSTVFSDFYLFTKLYGINHVEKRQEIEKYLKLLRIDHKLTVENGVFSNLRLSTGQKKRLALLVSYLEDRPVCLFDECAADQDPEFRKFFYQELMPELKARHKCIIAITHDDHYFNMADRVIKMDLGMIIEHHDNPSDKTATSA